MFPDGRQLNHTVSEPSGFLNVENCSISSLCGDSQAGHGNAFLSLEESIFSGCKRSPG